MPRNAEGQPTAAEKSAAAARQRHRGENCGDGQKYGTSSKKKNKKQTHSPIYQICSVNSCSQRTSSHHHSGQQTVWSSARRQLSWEGPIMAHRNKQAGTKLYTQRGLLKPGTSGTMHGMPRSHHMKRNYEPFNLMYKQSLKSQLARSSE